MDDIDSLLDSLLVNKDAPQVSYINEEDAEKIEVRNTAAGGDCVFARKTLPVKDPIISLPYPTVLGIDDSFISKTCYHCLVVKEPPVSLTCHESMRIDLKLCNGCHFARFCSRDCQVKSWGAYHKFECKILKKMQNNQLPAILRAVLRLVLLKDRSKISDDDWNRITGLVSHQQAFGRGPSNLTQMAESIKLLAASSLSTDVIFKLILIMRANATELPDTLNGGIGVMLQPGVAKFNHSCEPNIAVHRPYHTMYAGWNINSSSPVNGFFAQVIPLRDIAEGEELFLSYIAPTKSVQDRQSELRDNYLFTCACPRCTSDAEIQSRLQKSHPDEIKQFNSWAKSLSKHISHIDPSKPSNLPSSFRRAASAMTLTSTSPSPPSYLSHQDLFTTGIYPTTLRTLTSYALSSPLNLYEEALLNVLRLHYLIDPHRYVGRHNPTNTYTALLILDVLDLLIGTEAVKDLKQGVREASIKSLKEKGLNMKDLKRLRGQIANETLTGLKATAAADLCAVVRNGDAESGMAEKEAHKTGQVDEKMMKILGVA